MKKNLLWTSDLETQNRHQPSSATHFPNSFHLKAIKKVPSSSFWGFSLCFVICEKALQDQDIFMMVLVFINCEIYDCILETIVFSLGLLHLLRKLLGCKRHFYIRHDIKGMCIRMSANYFALYFVNSSWYWFGSLKV